MPGTGRVGLSVGLSTSLDVATLLNELDRYPFGCSEQITSRAVAMLYVNELAAQARLAPDGEIDARITDAIARLTARQGSNGSFGLWSVGGNDAWLDAYVTDFLTRARERKFEVPTTAFTLALDRLRNYVATAPEADKNGGRELSYALYVLARNAAAGRRPALHCRRQARRCGDPDRQGNRRRGHARRLVRADRVYLAPILNRTAAQARARPRRFRSACATLRW